MNKLIRPNHTQVETNQTNIKNRPLDKDSIVL